MENDTSLALLFLYFYPAASINYSRAKDEMFGNQHLPALRHVLILVRTFLDETRKLKSLQLNLQDPVYSVRNGAS